MSGELVPFGKYKGQPVEAMSADREYCEWLLAQPWFASRYGNVYNILISHGGEPQDSPEHNEMQARFLDEQWCFALADVLDPASIEAYRNTAALEKLNASAMYKKFRSHAALKSFSEMAVTDFEVSGWDVSCTIAPARIELRLGSLPACTCRCDHDHNGCYQESACRGGQSLWGCDYAACRNRDTGEPGRVKTEPQYHCGDDCPWHDRDTGIWLLDTFQEGREYEPRWHRQIRVELKPDLGDDYPSVLRQVKGYPAHGTYDRPVIRCVVARRYEFRSVTWQQVQKIFAASDIRLVDEREIAEMANPETRCLKLLEAELGAQVISE